LFALAEHQILEAKNSECKMPRRLIVAVLACLVSACGADTPITPTPVVVVATRVPAPIASANLVMSGSLSVPGCEPRMANAFGLGLSTIDCPTFSGVMQNLGAGCANAVRGTTTSYVTGTSQVIGSHGWSYGFRVRPGESFGYSGGPLTVPSRGTFEYRTTAAWDNVSCS
jgi:hypothetical protein